MLKLSPLVVGLLTTISTIASISPSIAVPNGQGEFRPPIPNGQGEFRPPVFNGHGKHSHHR